MKVEIFELNEVEIAHLMFIFIRGGCQMITDYTSAARIAEVRPPLKPKAS